MTEAEAIVIMRQIVQGVSAIKKHGVVHRDLKLENILVNYPERPDSELQEYVRTLDLIKATHRTF